MDAVLARAQAIDDQSFREVQRHILQYHSARPKAVHGKGAKQGPNPEVLVELLFYTPPSDDYMINRLVSKLTSRQLFKNNGESYRVAFAHVELSFPYDPDTMSLDKEKNLSFSITQNSVAGFRERTYWRDGYSALAISLSRCAYINLFNVCLEISSRNIQFDKLGMYLAPYASRSFLESRTDETTGTFCSKLIVCALQRANVAEEAMRGISACQSTPTSLYLALSEHFIPTKRFDTRSSVS